MPPRTRTHPALAAIRAAMAAQGLDQAAMARALGSSVTAVCRDLRTGGNSARLRLAAGLVVASILATKPIHTPAIETTFEIIARQRRAKKGKP